jgi:lysine-N-methylase
MKIFAPAYYKDFACIADRCRHSCCIGWEIDIDADTMQKYTEISHPYGTKIRESIDCLDTPHFRLSQTERCPHLAPNGLCHIISTLGEGYLCEICREHPRFYNQTPKGLEIGVGMACEEACRLILETKNWQEILPVGEIDQPQYSVPFDALAHRARIYGMLGDRTLPYSARLTKICDAYDVHPDALANESWRQVLASLEYLHEEHRALFAAYSSDAPTTEESGERALAYFIYRHCTAAEDEADLRARLGFCLLCERLLCSLVAQGLLPVAECARVISEELEYCEENTDAICNVFRLI